MISAAQNLASGLNSASDTVQSVRETADQDMVNSVATINSLLSQFQQVNTAIVNGTATGADTSDALKTSATRSCRACRSRSASPPRPIPTAR